MGALIVGVVALGMLAGAGAAVAASGGTGIPPGGSAAPGGSMRASGTPTARASRSNPFRDRGMWIWVLGSTEGGNVSAIIARARSNGVSTLMIKSGDGAGTWSQFNASLVAQLHRAGLRVCAWQYVYGVHPGGEAKVGAAAVAAGADCLLIDAESEYEGRYVQAQTYVTTLRRLIGGNFPVALAGFPYVDYHPGFPYSVFLGPGGAQYNVPQMYWYDIGTSVDAVYAHTYAFNRMYQRPISPLGQVYNAPPAGDIRRFRAISRSYGAPGVSWWDWQEASGRAWHAVSQPVGSLADFTAQTALASLGNGAKGDLVVWAQEHLYSAGQHIEIDGAFGPNTKTAVLNFQTAHALTATGVLDTATWQALLRYRPAAVRWTNRGARLAAASAGLVQPVPKSASLPAKRNEIAGAGGAGRP